jgi:GntR family transcriptional regulator, transcriptional repressor for pyruvate dehydrogenase complex
LTRRSLLPVVREEKSSTDTTRIRDSDRNVNFEATRFRPPLRTSISQDVLDQILAEIREGRIKPGERLPSEKQLMEAFAVGRSTVREALRGLVTLGLVTNRQGWGAIVTTQAESPFASLRRNVDLEQLNKRALLDLLEVREALEAKAAEFAARRATAEDIAEVERQHKAVEKAVGAKQTYFRQNTLFHKAIATAAHNPVLADSINVVVVQVREYRERLMREAPLMPQRDVEEHFAIVTAIRRRNPQEAREAMIAHIRSYVRVVESQTEASAASK